MKENMIRNIADDYFSIHVGADLDSSLPTSEFESVEAHEWVEEELKHVIPEDIQEKIEDSLEGMILKIKRYSFIKGFEYAVSLVEREDKAR